MAPFPENSSIFSCVLYTYNVCTCCTSSSHNEAVVDGTGYTWYIHTYVYIYISPAIPAVWSCFLSWSPNLTVSLRTHCAHSTASSSGNAEQFPHSDICYLLILVCAVFLCMRRVVMSQPVRSHCCPVLLYERDVLIPREIPFCTSWLVFLFNSLPDPAQQEDPSCIQKCQSKSKTQWRKLNWGETEKNQPIQKTLKKFMKV